MSGRAHAIKIEGEDSNVHPQQVVNRVAAELPEGTQLAVGLVKGDTTALSGVARTRLGVRHLDNSLAVFEIGSITKVFTATLLAYAVRQGTVSLDTPVQELVPFRLREARRDGVDVTLKHLANHTSGIRHHQPPYLLLYSILHCHPRQPFRNYSQARFEFYLRRRMSLAFVPGTAYRYSNIGMSLLGYALSRASGRTYEELLRATLFDPLGMSLSTTHVSRVRDHVVPGLARAGVRAPNWDMFALSPAGGIKTCASDLAAFVHAQLSPDCAIALTQGSTAQTGRKNVQVGLGWHIEGAEGEPVLNHGGGMLGYTAQVLVNPEAKRGVLVLSNLGNYRGWQVRIYELARELLGLEVGPDRR